MNGRNFLVSLREVLTSLKSYTVDFIVKKDITCWNKNQTTQFVTDETYENFKNKLTPILTEISDALLCENSEEVAVYIAGYVCKWLNSKINGSSSSILFLFAPKKTIDNT